MFNFLTPAMSQRPRRPTYSQVLLQKIPVPKEMLQIIIAVGASTRAPKAPLGLIELFSRNSTERYYVFQNLIFRTLVSLKCLTSLIYDPTSLPSHVLLCTDICMTRNELYQKPAASERQLSPVHQLSIVCVRRSTSPRPSCGTTVLRTL